MSRCSVSGSGSGSPRRSSRHADNHAAGRDVVDDDGVCADDGSRADRHRPDDLGASSDLRVLADDRTLVVRFDESDRDERSHLRAGVDLDEPVDDDLAMREAHTGMHEDRVADRELTPDHCGAVRQDRDEGDAASLRRGLDPVEKQRAEAVGDEREPDDLERDRRPRLESIALAALVALQLEVGEDGLPENGVTLLDRSDQRPIDAPAPKRLHAANPRSCDAIGRCGRASSTTPSLQSPIMDEARSAEDPITKGVARMIAGVTDFFADAAIALQVNAIKGDYVEFGSYSGTTFALAYKALTAFPEPRHFWAFDSWRAMPNDHPRDAHPGWSSAAADWPTGGAGGVATFHAACERNGVPVDAYTAVEGYYADTLPTFAPTDAPTDIALAYIDCDAYSSTVLALDFLAPRLKHGMIVGFDDYFCWSPTEVSGEQYALKEFLAAHPEWTFQRYRNIHWSGLAFVVERTESPLVAGNPPAGGGAV